MTAIHLGVVATKLSSHHLKLPNLLGHHVVVLRTLLVQRLNRRYHLLVSIQRTERSSSLYAHFLLNHDSRGGRLSGNAHMSRRKLARLLLLTKRSCLLILLYRGMLNRGLHGRLFQARYRANQIRHDLPVPCTVIHRPIV